MSDVFTKQKRSEVMSRIRGKGNRDTELAMAALLRKAHVSGWRRHQNLPGRPDFEFRRTRIALFVDGCFWHRCPKCFIKPVNNAGFWSAKLGGNVARDKRVNRALRKNGYRVVRVWEHEFKYPARLRQRILRLFQVA